MSAAHAKGRGSIRVLIADDHQPLPQCLKLLDQHGLGPGSRT